MRSVTYSKNVFIPVTNLCINRCGYCSFRRDLGRARIVRRSEAEELMIQGSRAGCTEALFSMGERPWMVPGSEGLVPGREGVVEYLVELCEMALEHGLLPHTNAGLLDQDDLRALKPYNASMGLMLETTARVDAHLNSPGKDPELRRSFISLAGKMRIPFTTGLLVGIGESREDRISSLRAISELHRAFGHIQEVIVQPFDPKPETLMAGARPPSIEEVIETVRLAREILPDVGIQVPPNLVDPKPLLDAGADDLGGISTVTPDWINPQRPWPEVEALRMEGYRLVERLPVYPRYVLMGWHGAKTSGLVRRLSGPDGMASKNIGG